MRPGRTGFVAALAAALTAAAAGCTRTMSLGTAAHDAAADAVPLCEGNSPGVRLGGGALTCAGRVAARTFRFALCSCLDVDLAAGFRTDSFDDRAGPYMPAAVLASGGGPVGFNGPVSIGAGVEIQGTLIVAGPGTLTIGDAQIIHGDLKTNGDLLVGKSVLVRRDAWVRGSITAPDGVAITGDLWQPAGAAPPAGLLLGGRLRTEDFTVAPPCACGPGDDTDIVSATDDARVSNDNALSPLAPGDLTDPPADAVIRLPCGRFYVDAVAGTAQVTLRVEGRAVLFVGGDFTAWDGLHVEFAPGGELDLFVAGDFTLGAASSWGDPLRAAALRIYVAGRNASMANATTFAGNLYAPVATVAASDIEIFGSVTARGLHSTAPVRIHFDRAVLGADGVCSDTAAHACATCSDCLGTDGCSGGRCGACASSLDCCDPLVCSDNHRCVALVF